VERDKTCPFLLRLFFKEGGSHSLSEFDENDKTPSAEEEI
jgi:hypothetical protein